MMARRPGLYMRRPPGERICSYCADPFRPMSPNQRICGKVACRRALQQQQRARYLARISSPSPEVRAQVVIQSASGSEREFTMRLWRGLPSWWNAGSLECRQRWLERYFRRRLPVAAGAKILRVTVAA